MAKLHDRPAAIIDIGSSGVRMLVSQWNGKQVEQLDYLEKPILLGQEVFSTGYLTFETVLELSAILSGFCAVAQEYGVGKIQVSATTALREASNQAYVLDHLYIHNKLQVQVMEDAEAGALLFHHLRRELPDNAGRALLAYSGTGIVDFAVQSGGTINFIHSMQTGLIKVAELLRAAEEQSLHSGAVAREFLQAFLERQDAVLDLGSIDSLVFGMGELGPLLALCGYEEGAEGVTLSRKKLDQALETCGELSLGQLEQLYKLEEKELGAAFVALVLLHALCRATGVKRVRCVRCSTTDAGMELLLRPDARRQYHDDMRAGTIASVLALAEKHRCNLVHAEHVARIALTLFDKLRKLHGLSKRHSLFLHAACALHELARFTNAVNPVEATYYMVKDTQLYGVRSEEALLIANIIAPQSLLGLERGESWRSPLPEQHRLIAAKMHALLHLADALDYARRQKAVLTAVELEGDNRLTLRLQVSEDFALERLMFQQSGKLFREVFGITPVLEIEDVHRAC